MPIIPLDRFDELMESLQSYPDFKLDGGPNPFKVSKAWLRNVKENPALVDVRLCMERQEQVRQLHRWLNMTVKERIAERS